MAKLKERRRQRRIAVTLPITIEFDHRKISTQTKNISVLGTYVEINQELSLGAILNVKIKVPQTRYSAARKTRQINCFGVVFRCQLVSSTEFPNRYGIGIFFRSFLGDGEEVLSNYINFILRQEKIEGKALMRRRKK